MLGTRPSTRDLLTLLLVLLTIAISTYAAVGTINYFQFYPALTSLQVELTSLAWNSDGMSMPANVIFTITNPSGYKGMSLKVFQSFLELRLNITETIPQGSLPPTNARGPLDPAVPMTVRVAFNGSLDAPQRTFEVRTWGGEVRFVLDVNLTLATFLDKSAILVISYRCESTGPPEACQQTAITPHPNREEGGIPGQGGGGI